MNEAQNNHNQHQHQHQQACAACKYQRRKCAPDCILAPYFPHHKQRQFLNAHKLFGVSNITKIIKPLSQSAKDDAMTTIIFQSDVRATDPVGGCYRIILDLQRQIEYNKAELDLVLHHLMICRAHPHDPMPMSIDYQQQPPFDDTSNLVQDFNGWGLQDCVSSSSSCGLAQQIIHHTSTGGEGGLFREDADSIQKAQAQDQHLHCTFTLTNCNS